jgi:ketosteroid isomerase-like protein
MSTQSDGGPEAERAEILRLDKEWAAVAAAGQDLDRILSFWSDDATLFPPGAPALAGKAAIRQFVATGLQTPGFSVTWQTTQLTVSPAGER